MKIGLFAILLMVLGGIAIYFYRPFEKEPIIYSPKIMLTSLWNTYKEEYLEKETYRTVDKQRGNITTSEGQSYTMLRAVWQDDKFIFDKSWEWTKNNLQHQDDSLFAWLFGKRTNGSYGILNEAGGQNSASDGDADIALALVFAYSRWGDEAYLTQAKEVISDIWEKEVVIIHGKPYLAANDLEKNSPQSILVNPSYFSPYAYRIFAKIDPDHPWLELIDASYEIIQQSIVHPLDKNRSAKLPPNWIIISKTTGAISASKSDNLTTNYSYDALRLPWRLALDWEWNREPRAKQTLEMLAFLNQQWNLNGAIYSDYSHDGRVLSTMASPAMYGGSMGYFHVNNPDQAAAIYDLRLKTLFNPDFFAWKEKLSYYDDNWAWFGMALHNRSLANLAKDIEFSFAIK